LLSGGAAQPTMADVITTAACILLFLRIVET
jgi:hypothetical protein